MPPLNAHDAQFLRDAVAYLESPSLVVQIANYLGKPVEWLASKAPRQVTNMASAALRKAMDFSASSVCSGRYADRDLQGACDASWWTHTWHQLAAATTGMAGGLLGLPGLALELPVSTGIMLRAVASIADDLGADLRDPCVRLECLGIFSHGGPGPEDDAVDAGYLATRVQLAVTLERAARFLAGRTPAQVLDALATGTAGPVLEFIGGVAVRFSIPVSRKFLAQSLPLFGAVTGATLNAFFTDHFCKVARFHFGIRKLEVVYGPNEVHAVYSEQTNRLRAAASSRGKPLPLLTSRT